MAELIVHDPNGWHPGEREVAALLQRELPDDWLLAAHVVIPHRDDDRELDLVVVGDGYVHNVEVKNASGHIFIDAGYMRSGGGTARPSPLRQAGTAAKVLRGVFNRDVPGFDRLQDKAVTSRVVFSHPGARLAHVDDEVKSRVSTLGSVVDDLLRKDRSSNQLTPLRPLVRPVLAAAELRDPLPQDLHGFRVIERLDYRRSCLTLRCQHFVDDSMWIVRLMQPKPTLDPAAGSRELAALLTEYEALATLAPLGVAPQVERPIRLDTDQVMVAITEPDGRSLLDLIEDGHRPQEDEVRRVVHEAFRSLAVVHEQGHLHRALTPDRVIVKPNGGVLLTDFRVAHVDGRTGYTSVLAELDPDDEHERYWRAPETRTSIVPAVPASDVFALASTLKAWVIGSIKSADVKKDTLSRHGEARQRLGSSLDDFVQLLKSCRSNVYMERATAAEIADRWAPDEPAPPPATTVAEDGPNGVVVPLCRRELAPGDRVDERFVVRRRLGYGATAVTVLAYDEQSEREVVLKGFDFDRVPPELAKQEFAALLELNHDRIAVVRDRYQPQHPYHLVIDYAPGSPAAEQMGAFIDDADTVAAIARALLQGLAYLHSRRVLHRDISAGNVILGDIDPADLRIVDFGLATLEAEVTGSIGTPLYRAPEIESGGTWTAACDTYSAGVLLYQLLTDEVPYVIQNGLIKARPAEIPTGLSPESRRLAELFLTATAFDPDARFPDGSEFLDALEDRLATPAPEDGPPTTSVITRIDAYDSWADTETEDDTVESEDEVEDEESDSEDFEDGETLIEQLMVSIRESVSQTTTRVVHEYVESARTATFHPASRVSAYDGNAWLAPGRLRRYRVGLDHAVRAVVLRGGTEQQVQADPVDGLVEAINRAKRAGRQSDGGSFVVNEHGHVLVPTGQGIFFAGILEAPLTFRQGALVLTAEPDGLSPGDMWTGLLAGVRYRLKAGGNDIEYERADGRVVRLSDVVGVAAANTIASGFARVKRGGGRLYVNEAGTVTSPMQRGHTWVDVYVGRVDPDMWFPAPEVH